MGLLTPARPLTGPDQAATAVRPIVGGDGDAESVRRAGFLLGESVSVAERIEHLLHPLTSLVIIPLFALANAGIEISGDSLGDAAGSAVTLGVVFGLVVGKITGIGGLFAAVVAAVIGSVILYRASPASIQPAADVDRPPPGT